MFVYMTSMVGNQKSAVSGTVWTVFPAQHGPSSDSPRSSTVPDKSARRDKVRNNLFWLSSSSISEDSGTHPSHRP